MPRSRSRLSPHSRPHVCMGAAFHPCAAARTNFLERSTQEISVFSKRTEQVEDFTFTSWVFTLEKEPQSGQEKRYVPFLNQSVVFLASPAMA